MTSETSALPDFGVPALRNAPDATLAPAPRDGVLPEGFFATTNLPTYLKVNGDWLSPTHPRMDGALVVSGATAEVLEPRRVRAGTPVALGSTEDGSEGVYVERPARSLGAPPLDEFQFMGSEVSRERPVDYQGLAERLRWERDHDGYLVWVPGPALVHARARADFVWFVEQGFVQAVLTGNAVAVHDIETALFGTTLGMQHGGLAAHGGHGFHMRAINTIRGIGSIEEAVATGVVRDGIMATLVRRKIPFVLAGSIRDDGPLPGVITDVLEAQDAMRTHVVRATGALFVASALHGIAVGNMLPAFHRHRGDLEPMLTICVDQTEFVVTKLKDRGTHQAIGIVTNAQDFMYVLRHYVEQCNPT